VAAGEAAEETPAAFLFPGQGAQQVNMGRGLYETESAFRNEIDRCCEILRPLLGLDLRALLYPPAGADLDAAQRQLTETWITQPALFVVEYALARLWMAWGVRPRAMIGHSLGEYVAACLAGVFDVEDALRLLARRARLMQDLPGGAMLAVRLPEAEVLPLLDPPLALAAVNGAALCVVSGPADAVAALRERLEAQGTACRPLHTSHAFHSAMMDPILAPFTEIVRSVALRAPQIPYVSGLTGTWITPEQATDPGYWARQLREAVRFADGFGELARSAAAAPRQVFLEVGPGQALTSLARQHPDKAPAHEVLASLDASATPLKSEAASLMTALGRMWTAGVSVDRSAVFPAAGRRRIPLPTYPFERVPYVAEPPAVAPAAAVPAAAPSPAAAPPALPAAGPPLIPPPTIALPRSRPENPCDPRKYCTPFKPCCTTCRACPGSSSTRPRAFWTWALTRCS
jgi:acyl transferase domain-containing protein